MSEERRKGPVEKAQDELLSVIIQSLKEKKLPWVQPWEGTSYLPYNPISQTVYKNTNQLTLLINQYVYGFRDPRWCTFDQAVERGWKIRKGSKATRLYFTHRVHQETGEPLKYEILKNLSKEEQSKLLAQYVIKSRSFLVFNGSQMDGLPKLTQSEKQGIIFEQEKVAKMTDRLIQGMEVQIEESGTKAYYSLTSDRVQMPERRLFFDEPSYYATLYHELGHATGHEKRLGRDMSGQYGSKEYALEELRAELASALLSLDMGLKIGQDHIDQHKAYCQSWAELLEDNPSLLMSIIRESHLIRKYMIEKSQIKEETVVQEVEQRVANGDQKEAETNKDHTQIDLEEIKTSVSIIDYAEEVLNLATIRTSGGLFQLVDHDSCKIYPTNTYYRFSTARGGSVIDFAMEFGDLSKAQAIESVKSYYLGHGPSEQIFEKVAKQDKSHFVLPLKAPDNKRVYAYLARTRCIKPDIINEYLKRGLVFQEDGSSNCVFVGKLENEIYYAARRSSSAKSGFRQDVPGSFPEIGVFYDNKSDTLVLTESVIDQMSYQSLEANPADFSYLSTNGIAKAINVVNFHMVKRNGKDNIKNIVIAFDNDHKGIEAAEKVSTFLQEQYPEINKYVVLPNQVDWNAELKFVTRGEIEIKNDLANQQNEVAFSDLELKES